MSGTNEEAADAVVEDPKTTVVEEPKADEVQAEPKADDKPKDPPWFMKRISELSGERKDFANQVERERAARLAAEAEVARLKSTTKEPLEELQDTKKTSVSADDTEVERQVSERLQIREFNDRCNAVYTSGKAEYSDFDAVMSNYSGVGGLTPNLVMAALETEAAHQVLYTLAKDPDKAFEVLRMDPVKQAIYLDRLATSLKAPKAAPDVSKAPAPLDTVRGARGSSGEPDPEKMTTAQWMKWRDEQVTKKKSA